MKASWHDRRSKGAVEEMQRQIAALGDQDRMVTRGGSIVAVDKISRRAIRLLGTTPETETREAFWALGFAWVERDELD